MASAVTSMIGEAITRPMAETMMSIRRLSTRCSNVSSRELAQIMDLSSKSRRWLPRDTTSSGSML